MYNNNQERVVKLAISYKLMYCLMGVWGSRIQGNTLNNDMKKRTDVHHNSVCY